MIMTSNYQTPTAETYAGLKKAFDHFNERLFENRLSPVMFTLTRKRGAHGYFWAEQFSHRDGDKTREIALNPQTMDREIGATLSTLVHGMTHLEQEEFGKPSKNGHHNMAWAELMPFDIPYFTQPREKAVKKFHLSKVKTTCPSCNFNAWAKQGANLVCGDCNEQMVGGEVRWNCKSGSTITSRSQNTHGHCSSARMGASLGHGSWAMRMASRAGITGGILLDTLPASGRCFLTSRTRFMCFLAVWISLHGQAIRSI
jgi:predicted SprT family Zn-dependent metalloprotease